VNRTLVALVIAAAAACRDDGVVGIDVPGPNCDCNSYFPTCVGASWTYAVENPQTGVVTPKTFSITDYSDPGRLDFDLYGFMAFRQRRVTDSDSKDSWLIQSPDGLQLIWLIDDWFDMNGRRTRTEWYDPGKLRMDESPDHTVVGATWHEHYTEHHLEMGTETIVEHQIDWETRPSEVHDPFGETLCEHKLDIASDSPVPVDATYCFARGVGKVYELTALVSEEALLDWTAPGCAQ